MPITTPLRIVTLNTWKGDGDYLKRLDAMAAGLAALAPDLVACQEMLVAPELGHDTAAFLAERLGLHCASVPARHRVRTVMGHAVGTWSGLALLSRWPIAEHHALPLPNAPEDGDRAALLATVAHPDGPVRIASVHLAWRDAEGPMRRRQLETILAQPWWREPAQARLLAGDFNAEDKELAWLQNTPDWQVVNAWDAAERILPTFDPANPWAGDLAEARCIDHFFALRPKREPVPVFNRCDRVLDRPWNGVLPSDHYGVLAELRM